MNMMWKSKKKRQELEANGRLNKISSQPYVESNTVMAIEQY